MKHDESETGTMEVYRRARGEGPSRSTTTRFAVEARATTCAWTPRPPRQVLAGPDGLRFIVVGDSRSPPMTAGRRSKAMTTPGTQTPLGHRHLHDGAPRDAAHARSCHSTRAPQRFALETALGAGCTLMICDAVPVGPHSPATLRMRGRPDADASLRAAAGEARSLGVPVDELIFHSRVP
jgi:hypothetical protein